MFKRGLALVCIAGVSFVAVGKEMAPPDTAVVESVAKGNTAFAVDLYKNVAAAKSGNLFLSPLSMSTALAMTSAGARGETAQQMANVLHLPLNQTGVHEAFARLTQDFNAKSPDYELAVANALWGQKDYAFLDPFANTLKTNYGAGLTPVDFKSNAEGARNTINGWVEKQTGYKIKDLISPGVLDATTRLVLTNAVYFKSDWAEPFKKNYTRDEAFHVASDKIMTTPLMHLVHEFRYFEQDSFQALEMPYKGETFSMVILLPKDIDGLTALEQSVTAEKLLEWMKGLQRQQVAVTIPRFTMTSEFSMGKVLGEMGMPLPFSEAADFSGMTGKPELFISAVVHKAFVDVSEKGTEAAAATGVEAKATVASPAPPPEFRADHPFLFLIRDLRSDSILFMGRVVNPEYHGEASAFFQQCYQYGLWISVPLMVLGLYLLIFFIVKVVRVMKKALVTSLPLVEEQEVDFSEAGQLVLSGEGPLITFRFAKLKYDLTTSDGAQVPSRPTLFRARSSGLTSSRMEFRVYTIPEPGRYTLWVQGLGEAKESDVRHHLVFMKPHLLQSIGCVLGILLGAGLFIGNLVFFLLRLLTV